MVALPEPKYQGDRSEDSRVGEVTEEVQSQLSKDSLSPMKVNTEHGKGEVGDGEEDEAELEEEEVCAAL